MSFDGCFCCGSEDPAHFVPIKVCNECGKSMQQLNLTLTLEEFNMLRRISKMRANEFYGVQAERITHAQPALYTEDDFEAEFGRGIKDIIDNIVEVSKEVC